MVWLHLPDWFIAILVGVSGGIFIKRQPIICLLMFGLGFVVAPFLVSIVAGFNFAAFSLTVSLQALMWDAITIGLVVVFGIFSRRFRVYDKHAV